MAEGLLRAMGNGSWDVVSAGTKPSFVRPEAVAVMAERGIDISGHRSKHVDEFKGQTFDYVITVCDNAKESCPLFPGAPRRIHWSLPDPAAVDGAEEERLEAFRNVRAMLTSRFTEFLRATRGSSPRRKSRCIRRAMHPGWRRCSSFKYSRYSQSSRLASRAPRPSRCNAGLAPRAARGTLSRLLRRSLHTARLKTSQRRRRSPGIERALDA